MERKENGLICWQEGLGTEKRGSGLWEQKRGSAAELLWSPVGLGCRGASECE